MQIKSFGERITILRKKAELTQKELANLLGITEPAISKWETNSSMPDIMLLAPLARALHTDINTLFAYEEELSKDRVKEIVAVADSIWNNDGTEAELVYWKQVLQEYPNSEILHLEYVKEVTRLHKQGILSDEQYMLLEPTLLELIKSVDIEIKESALLYLISFYIRYQKYGEAEKYINAIPNFDFNAKHMKSLLSYEMKDYATSLQQSEQFLLECIQNVLICLSHMAEAESTLGNKQKEYLYTETMCRLEELFQLPFYRGAAQMITYYIRLGDYQKALECFDVYVDKIISADDILRNSEFVADAYPNVGFISNGELISLDEFKNELWKVVKKPEYMKKIRENEKFILAMNRLEKHFVFA